MASVAACIAPLCVASQSIHICQAVCHPLSGGSVACLVCASPHFTQATAPFARSLPVSVLPFSAMPFSVWQFTFTAQGNYRCKVRVEVQTLLIAAQGAAVRRGSAATRERDTRRIAQRSEAKCDRRPESARAPGCIRRRRDGDGRRRMVFHPKPHSPYRRADDAS